MLGERLAKLRKLKKLTQQQVAAKVLISRATYAQYEINRRVPEYLTLEKLADFFGVTIDYLVGRETKEPSIEETEDEANRKLAMELFDQIKDPIKREEAKSYMKYLANQQKQ